MAEPRRGAADTAARRGTTNTADRGTAARRAAAWACVVCLVAGAVAVTVAVVAGPGPGLTGYVSEAGVADSAYAPAYRIGVFALAAGVLLLAMALPPVLRAATVLLAAGSVLALVSGAVTCSAGCPLPPFERATTADLVHGAASILAVAAVVFAMLATVLTRAAPPTLRRLAGVALAVALPLAGATAVAMVTVGRGSLLAVLERLLLLVALLWGTATATTTALRREGRAPC